MIFGDGYKGLKDEAPFDRIIVTAGAPNVPKSPSGLGTYLKGKTFIKIDSHTIHIKTKKPYPLMPNDIMTVKIISKK